MTDNIVKFPGAENIELEYDEMEGGEVDTNQVLEGAKNLGLEEIILIGRRADGGVYFASTSTSISRILYDIECAKYILMNTTFPTLD